MAVDIEIRTIAPEELERWLWAVELAFGAQPSDDEIANERKLLETDRTLAAVDGGEFVGGASAYTFRLTVPGGDVPAAGITGVGVRPTHRRRGINTALMRRQLDDVRGREPLAVLFASEGGIYGRFGYGLASFMGSVDAETERAAFIRGYEPHGRMRFVDRKEAVESFSSVLQRAAPDRPGAFVPNATWLDYTFSHHHGSEAPKWFFAVHEGEDGVDGALMYEIKHEWPDSVPRNSLEIELLDALTPAAYADLWRLVLDTDLIHRVTAWNRPADEPLLHLLQEPRRARFRLKDGLWVRLVDVPAALSSRRYATSGRIVLDVRDRFCPWNEGRVELEGGPDGATCRPVDAEPDLVLTVNDLGAAYLGGVSFRQLHLAGRIEERSAGGLSRADAMFAWHPAPWCPLMF